MPSLDLRRSSLGVGLISEKTQTPFGLIEIPQQVALSQASRRSRRRRRRCGRQRSQVEIMHGMDETRLESTRLELNRVWSSLAGQIDLFTMSWITCWFLQLKLKNEIVACSLQIKSEAAEGSRVVVE